MNWKPKRKKTRMQQKWVKIYATSYLYKAEIAKSILAEHNITSVIVNKQDSAYGTFGEIELFTTQKNTLRAINIIKEIKYE